uniref:Uncharacterized protein n=1 Tax=Ditylenchus dipsaci TaxID=166011 RepID=A0A915EWP8_9BILA
MCMQRTKKKHSSNRQNDLWMDQHKGTNACYIYKRSRTLYSSKNMNKFRFFFIFCAFASAWALKNISKADNATILSSTTPTTTSAVKNGTISMDFTTPGIATTAESLQTSTTAEATTLAPTSVVTSKTTKVLSTTKKAATSKVANRTTKPSKKISATTTTKAPTTSFLTTILPKTKLTTKAATTSTAAPPSSTSRKAIATTTRTTTTTTTQPTTTVPNAPDSLMFQNLLKVRQCSCDETEACALSAGSQISDCKKQCAHKMEYFGQDIDKLVSCFMKTKEELRAFDKCLSSNSNFCVSNNNTLVYIDTPDYASFIGNQSLRANEIDAVKGGVLVKKARRHLCTLDSSRTQQQKYVSRCAVPVPSGEELGEILDGCSQMKVHDHVHSACHCLVQKQQVRKLIGVCPWSWIDTLCEDFENYIR